MDHRKSIAGSDGTENQGVCIQDGLLGGVLELPQRFKELCRNGQWNEAKEVYEAARKIAVEHGFSNKEKITLFGNRPYRKDHEKEVEGLFPECAVQKVYEMCIFGRHVSK